MQKILKRIKSLEEADSAGKKVIYISTIAPLNWEDIISVKLGAGDAIRFVSQVFKEGKEHIPQKTYDKLSESEEREADKYLEELKIIALREEAEHE